MDYYSLKWTNGALSMMDQRRLPQEVVYLEFTSPLEVAAAIRDMVIRGAPAIGAAAAYGMALAALHLQATSLEGALGEIDKAASILKAARPTAVNLAWGVERVLRRLHDPIHSSPREFAHIAFEEADRIFHEDVEANIRIGQNALELIPQNARVIHHCNTGALATCGYGTALGVIRAAHEAGRNVFVYVDETRPRLQGARLTAWELERLGIPHQIIVDGAASHVMRTCGVDLCVVGCDRIAGNGDVANKIGTYQLAAAAHLHRVPFYSAGPTSTIDPATPDGDHIPVEERSAEEVTIIDGSRVAPQNSRVFNPAFDITPAEYISAIITEAGICRAPYGDSLRQAVNTGIHGRR